MMLTHTRRLRLIQTASSMNESGLNQGTAGNVSLRVDNGFLITPSALAYDRCKPADVVEMDMHGKVRLGHRRPSSEWRLHRDIFSHRPDAGAVLHAHPPWCTTLACLEREIPACHYMVAMAGGDRIACAPYGLFGTAELSNNVLAALDNGRCACLLAHHGMVCYAGDLQEVFALAIEVENLARVYGQALQIGDVPVLSAGEMQAVRERFVDYKAISAKSRK